MQLGLAIDGEVLTSVSSGDLVPFGEPLLSSIPFTGCTTRNTIKLLWLNNVFQQLLNDANKVVISQHA